MAENGEYRRWLAVTLGLAAGGCALIIALNLVLDPLRQYWSTPLYDTYYKNERYLNPGLAKTRDYDTILTGTSMIENFRPSRIDSVLGTRSIKLPMSGGSAHEFGVLLGTALEVGKVRRVLFGLDVFSFYGEVTRTFSPAGLPLYLYDFDRVNDIRYLMSWPTLMFAVKGIRANLRGSRKDLRRLDPDLYGAWAHKFEFSREATLDEWEAGNFNRDFRLEDWSFEDLRRNFDENLLPHIEGHPEVHFDLLYPPYSILVWVDNLEKGILDTSLRFKRHVFERVGRLENVAVHDFQTEASITHDLDRYKDISHYAPEINDFMIEAIASGEYRVTPERLEPGLATLAAQARSFRLDGDGTGSH